MYLSVIAGTVTPAQEADLRQLADEAGEILKQHPQFRSGTFALDRGAGQWVIATRWATVPPDLLRARPNLGARLAATGATIDMRGDYEVVAETGALPPSVG